MDLKVEKRDIRYWHARNRIPVNVLKFLCTHYQRIQCLRDIVNSEHVARVFCYLFLHLHKKKKNMCLPSTLRKSVIYGMLAEIDFSPNGGARNAVALFDRHVTAGLTEVH